MTQEKKDKPDVFVPKESPTPIYPATVVHVISDYKLVINLGSKHGIRPGQRFLIYAISSEDILDPETKESLGRLEIVRGTGEVVYIQESMTTIKSNKKRITRRLGRGGLFSFGETIIDEEEVDLPFEAPKVGDKARPI